jgi:fumarylacetoacetate (FAA) hydrolase family protein
MTQLSKKLEKLIRSSQEILPVKTDNGILVGDILIASQGPTKYIYKQDTLIYKEIHLNAAAITIANLMARRKETIRIDEIYRADQEYGKWFVDSQLLRAQYEKSKQNQDFDRADMLWARYIESRDRTILAKTRAEALCVI